MIEALKRQECPTMLLLSRTKQRHNNFYMEPLFKMRRYCYLFDLFMFKYLK